MCLKLYMENFVKKLFYPTTYFKKTGWDRNITAYSGKHYLERHLGKYLSTEDFQNLMELLGHKEGKRNGMYS